MTINVPALQELIKEKHRNNNAWFSEVIGVSRGYFSELMNGKIPPTSKKAIIGIIKYCKDNNIDINKYIIM